MRLHKVVRYIGLALLAISFVAMTVLYSFSYSGIGSDSPDRKSSSVLLVTEDEAIPQTELRAVFHAMGLSYKAIRLSENADLTQKQAELEQAVQSVQSDDVILLATRQTAYPALVFSRSSQDISGLVLLAPEISPSEDLSGFGAMEPMIPTILLSPDDDYVRAAYERLSGEDAQLFPGIKENGMVPYEVYASPNGRRYLSLWDVSGTPGISKTIFPFLPGVTEEIGGLISTFILNDAKLASDARIAAQAARSVTSGSGILSLAGLCLFLSSIPVSRKKTALPDPDIQPQADVPADTVLPSGGKETVLPDVFPDSSTRYRYKRKAIAIEILIGALVSSAAAVLFFVKREYSIYPVMLWPAFYYALFLPYLPTRANRLSDRSVPKGRSIISGIVMFLFYAAVVSLLLSIRPDPVSVFLSVRAVLALACSVSLFFSVRKILLCGIAFGTESIGKDSFSSENSLLSAGLRALIFLPSLVLFLLSVFSGDGKNAQASFLFIVFIAISLYLRFAFRTIGGTAKAGAVAFAAFYLAVIL